MKKILLAASIAVTFALVHAQDKPLSADEVKALVSGKILDFPEDARGVTRQIMAEAGGTGFGSARGRVYGSGGTLSAPLKWRVSDKGELCTHVQQAGWSENCYLIQKTQDGSYARVTDGKVHSTFTVR